MILCTGVKLRLMFGVKGFGDLFTVGCTWVWGLMSLIEVCTGYRTCLEGGCCGYVLEVFKWICVECMGMSTFQDF